ncbi:MAG: hypothetical protein SFU56_19300 [Capsulimonadales bacterium]|nr:hypothetical protein [Capsulimonadales bacterium]
MLIKRLREAGLTSDMAYAASLASIGLSVAVWFSQREKDAAYGERFGIFIGLWAPTLAVFGNALKTEEKAAELP